MFTLSTQPRRWSAALLSVLVFGACDSPTPPDPPRSSEKLISVEFAGPDTATGRFNGNVFGCTYPVRTTAAGDPGAVATWTGARVELRPSQGGAAYVDSISAAGVAELFGRSEITAGETRDIDLGSGFSFGSPSDANALRGAHTAHWSFRYRTGTQFRTSTYTLNCKPPNFTLVPAVLEIAGGTGQNVTVATPLGGPLIVQVRDQLGKPYPGAAVRWTVVSGEGAKLIPVDSVTDANGLARASLTPGTKAGHYAVSASVEGLSGVEFTLFARPGPIASVILSPARLTLGAIGETAQVRPMLADSLGNEISGALLTWTSEDPRVAETGGGWPDPPGVMVNARGTGSTQLVLTAKRLETGEEVRKPLPVTVLALGEFATDFGRSCGVTLSGQLYCWGDNFNGALGDGTTTSRVQAAPVSTGLSFSQLSIGRYTVCGLTSEGRVHCWGQNAYGELGNGAAELRRLTPVPVTGGHTFSFVSTGINSSCALTGTGEAYCWGLNALGQLGRDTLTSTCLQSGSSRCSSVPIPVAGQLRLKSVSVGNWDHTCGVTTGGDAYCWGANGYGQLGTRVAAVSCTTHFVCVRTPALVEGGVTFSSVTAGFNFSCGLDTAGRAYCWGMGFGPAEGSRPVAVGGGQLFQALDAGDRLVCGLTSGGGIFCWGGSYGSTPVALNAERVYTELSVGEGRVCGRVRGGGVYCWAFDRRT
jgi:hypothetical protein